MYVVCVTVHVAEGRAAEFLAATLDNARATRGEPANRRFDLLRGADDPGRFFIYEVYSSEQGFRDHQQTPHYLAWRERVAAWMAQPRQGVKYTSLYPENESDWTAG